MENLFSTLPGGVGTITNIVDSVIKSESSDEKFVRMKRKFEALESREQDINEELRYAETLSMKKPRNEVKNWLREVGIIKPKVREVEDSKGKWYPSIQLHRNLDRLTAEIEELYHGCQFPRGLTFDAQEKRGITFPTTRLVGRMFAENKDFVLQCLRDENVLSIGVYGMGGVGKSALITHVNNELVSDFAGFSVSWVTVSQGFNVYKLQESVANASGLSLFEEDVKKRAAELSGLLQRKKKFVLILDDVWEDIDLDEVGISLGVDGCKLILTTRLLDVCRKMRCGEVVRVVPLSVDESWELFRRKLGDEVEIGSSIEDVARSVVKECAGLPLGIITMARSMRRVEDLFEWKNALASMRESKIEHCDMEKVFRVLRNSYDMLKDPKVQECFLDCSLYPEDYLIERDKLIEQFIDERLIEGMKSQQAEIFRGETMLNKLVNACLLETFENRGRRYVKMHDLIRDMALQITSLSPRFLVSAGVGLKEIPDEENWDKDLVKVSLMKNSFSEIRVANGSPNCPKISTLMLSFNFKLKFISDSFFQHMVGLIVLDLSYSEIEFLPGSISALVNLAALLLNRCRRLEKIPSLANLKALRRLDLGHSGIKELPPRFEVLLKLKDLNLLTQTLEVRPNFYGGIRGRDSSEKLRVRGEELTRLRSLEILKIRLYTADDLNTYVKSLEERELISYIIQVGCDENSFNVGFWAEIAFPKIVFISKVEIRENAACDKPLLLPQGIQFLCIDSCNMVRSLSKTASLDSLTNLRKCHIFNSAGIENLLSAPLSPSSPLLQNIEELKLRNLNDFRGLISEGRVSSSLPSYNLFSSLKDISIINCPKIKKLFTPLLMSADGNGERTTRVCLPKLMSLELRWLKNLTSFCGQQVSFMADSLCHIHIDGCPSLKKLLFLDAKMCSYPCLEKICVSSCYQIEEIIGISSARNGEGTTRICLPRLTTLELGALENLTSFCDQRVSFMADSLRDIHINDCPSLKKLLFLDAKICLYPCLEKIRVANCHQIEKIIGISFDMNREGTTRISLPNLKTIELRWLKNLTSFCDPRVSFVADSLSDIRINGCQSLKKLSSHDAEMCSYPCVENICVSHCDQIEEIIGILSVGNVEVIAQICLPRLKTLELRWLKNLTSFCDQRVSFVADSLCDIRIYGCPSLKKLLFLDAKTCLYPCLEKICVSHCDQIEEIIGISSDGKEEETARICLPKLKTLELHRLKNLTSFCDQRVSFVVDSLRDIHIDDCPSMKKLLFLDEEMSSYPCLEKICVFHSDQIEEIIGISSDGKGDGTTRICLPKLKTLKLRWLKNMVSFCDQRVSIVADSLRYIHIDGCPSLKILSFLHAKICSYPCLEKICISQCDQIKEIIRISSDSNGEGTSGIYLPKLKTLELQRLKNLTSFCSQQVSFMADSLRDIHIDGCPNLKKLSFLDAEMCFYPCLEKICVSHCDQIEEIIGISSYGNREETTRICLPRLKTLELQWLKKLTGFCDQRVTFVADSLRDIHIDNCPSLTKLSFLDAEMCLYPCLEKICVSHCDQIKEIIGISSDENGEGTRICLPRLKILELRWLKNLTSFCDQRLSFVGDSLRYICIDNCPSLKKLSFLDAEMCSYPCLEKICVSQCDQIEEIIGISSNGNREGTTRICLPRLKTLELRWLKNLTTFCDQQVSFVADSLLYLCIDGCLSLKKLLFLDAEMCSYPCLEKICVSHCDQIEEIIGISSNGNGEVTTRIHLPRLKTLELRWLKNLTSFCDQQVSFVAGSLRDIRINGCPSLLKLSFLDAEMFQYPCLEKIKVEETWWDSLDWDNLGANDFLAPLCHFIR